MKNSTLKERTKLAQRHLTSNGFPLGEVDGVWGKRSEEAWRQYKGINIDESKTFDEFEIPNGNLTAMVKAYGEACTEANLVRFELPYPMKLAWELGQTVTSSRCHKHVREPLVNALTEIFNVYGMAKIQELGLDKFGGIYNCRKVRGGSSPSKHSWGVAIDLNPNENSNNTPWVDGKQGDEGHAAMPLEVIEIFEKHGFLSGARAWGRDAMHFELTKG